jgi:hypothetical protein
MIPSPKKEIKHKQLDMHMKKYSSRYEGED